MSGFVLTYGTGGDYTTLALAVAAWYSNNEMVQTPSGTVSATNPRQQKNNVKFLQVGSTTEVSQITLLSFIDSMGFDFIVDNPMNFNITANTDNYIDFNYYKCAIVVLNRHYIRASSSGNLIRNLGTNATFGNYHSDLNKKIEITCSAFMAGYTSNSQSVLAAGSSAFPVNVDFYDGLSTAYAVLSSSTTTVRKANFENFVFAKSGWSNTAAYVLAGVIGIEAGTFRRNILLKLSSETQGSNIIPTSALLETEVSKNLFCGTMTWGDVPAVNQEINPADLFPFVENGLTFPLSSSWISNSFHHAQKIFTPNYQKLLGVVPAPDKSEENPLTVYMNGGTHAEWGNQYGACAYAYQQPVAAPDNLTATDNGDLTITLNWTNPTSGIPSGFTKWGIYKNYYYPDQLDDQKFIERMVKVGEVPITATTFTDDGSVWANNTNQVMYYRIRAEK